MDTGHTSDKGKGRGSPALANSPAPRPQSSKKGSSITPSQPQKKHKVSLYYTKYKSSSSSAAAGAVMVDEEHEDLTPDPPLTPDPDICNNNEPAFISEMEKKIPADFKEEPHSTIEERVPAAVMFPMEMPAGFPDNVTLSPGPRPGLLLCSPVDKSCTEHYAEKIDSEKRDRTEMEVCKVLIHLSYSLFIDFEKHVTKHLIYINFFVFFLCKLRENEKGQKKKAQNAEAGTVTGNNKGKRSRRKTENASG